MLSKQSTFSFSPAKTALARSDDESFRIRIMVQYQKWKGTNYMWGGTTRNGIDCSALVQQLFNDAANLSLPRTTGEQILRGIPVEKYHLKVGDLIFFQISRNTKHVGVYIGDSHFIHASSSKGVTVSNLANKYWYTRFITARRVTEDIS